MPISKNLTYFPRDTVEHFVFESGYLVAQGDLCDRFATVPDPGILRASLPS